MKSAKTIRGIALMLCSCLLCACATGCDGRVDTTVQNNTLTICVEEATYSYLEGLLLRFGQDNPGIELKIVYLPDAARGAQNRVNFIDSLRTEILAGAGPDAYLLNSTPYYYRTAEGALYREEALFPDVNKSALAGVFTDLSPLIDAAGVDTGTLHPAILEAGQFGGGQLIMPLGYIVHGWLMPYKMAEGTGLLNEDTDTLQQQAQIAALCEELGMQYKPSYPSYLTLLSAQPLWDYETGETGFGTPFARQHLEAYTPGDWSTPDSDSIEFPYYTVLGAGDYQRAEFALAKSGDTAVFVPLATETGGTRAEVYTFFAVSPTCKNTDAAAALLEFVLRAENQLTMDAAPAHGKPYRGRSNLQYMPINQNSLAPMLELELLQPASIDSIVAGIGRIDSAVIPAYNTVDIWNSALKGFLNGTEDAETALAAAEAAIRRYLAE